MSSTNKAKRIARVMRRGSPELIDALHKGLISARLADTLFYLPLDQQLVQLRRRLNIAAQREHRSRLVAQTIRTYLSSTPRIDLQELQRCIEAALSSPAPYAKT